MIVVGTLTYTKAITTMLQVRARIGSLDVFTVKLSALKALLLVDILQAARPWILTVINQK